MASVLTPSEPVTPAPAVAAEPSRETASGAFGGTVTLAAAAIGAGLALVVGLDGSPGWRAVRLLLTAAAAAAPVLAARRWSARRAAVPAVLVSAVAAPVGMTIGITYLTRAGFSGRAMGGLLAGAGGLLMLVAGALVLVRAARGWHRLAVIPAVLFYAYAAVLPLTQAVYAANVPRPALGAQTPAAYGLAFEDATFVTSDGVTLSGWYIRSTNRAAVVLLHGASSTRSNVLPQAAVLAAHGYGVLLFDARGHGRSGGRAMEFGWYGDQDVAAAVTYLQGRPELDPARIGAVGLSMGGEEAIGAMAADPRVKATVAEGATTRTFADRRWLADQFGLSGRIQQGDEWLTYGLAALLSRARPPISLHDAVAAAAPRPLLLIAAGRVADESHAANYIRAGSPSTVEIWVVPGAVHIGGLAAQPGAWALRVSAFLDGALLDRP